jgi:hypothetical protein
MYERSPAENTTLEYSFIYYVMSTFSFQTFIFGYHPSSSQHERKGEKMALPPRSLPIR